MYSDSNVLLLRTYIQKLFDLGYVSFDENHRFVFSSRLKADFDNGKHYYDLHATPLRAPSLAAAAPSPGSLDWHRNSRFRG